ncbi:MAG: 30S ribosomal protein S18 [Planctomycetota bacterium]
MSIEAPVSDRPAPKQKIVIDYKNIDDLRRAMTANGKIMSRKRAGLSARDQARLAQAIKRARFLGLLPYVIR